jgi:hypothetical protein
MPGVSDKKRAYGARLVEYIENYKSAFIVHCDNVGSKQMQQVRVALRGTAAVLMGKNVSKRVQWCGRMARWRGGMGWRGWCRERSWQQPAMRVRRGAPPLCSSACLPA